MKYRLLPLAAVALVASAQAQTPVRTFPMQRTARQAADALTLRPALDEVRALTALDRVTLSEVPLASGETVAVELERIDLDRLGFAYFADGQPRPDLAENLDLSLWKGHVVGEPRSEVRLSFSNFGSRGWIRRAGDVVHYTARPDADGSWLESRVGVTSDSALAERGVTLGQFCAAEEAIDGYELAFDPQRVTGPGLAAAPEGANGCNVYECTIAVETDFQLFQIFGDLSAETAYITTLLGYISDRYEEQINTILTFPYLMFYTNAGDPWSTPDGPGSSGEMLDEFVTAWAGNIPTGASLGHFISGAGLGGGIAYLDVLGNPDFGFGVSGNIDSNVNFPVMQQPDNWDFMVIAHELGHNFSAPHTHSVCPPIDECPSSQYWGPCQDETICLTDGTIMSYCHLCPGGTGNITTYFHPENVARMQSAASLALPPAFATVSGSDLTTIGENAPTPVSAQITGGSPITGVFVNYRYDGGSFQSVALADQGGGLYGGNLPPADCGDSVEYYYSFTSPDCGLGTDPLDAPASVYTAEVGTLSTLFGDDFEADTGWTATNLGASTGDWQRGVPVDDPGWAYDPASDYDGSGQCYLTQNENGNTDIDDGAVRLTSPTLDSSSGAVALQYAYYLRLTVEGGDDALVVEWSSNGDAGPWTEIARHEANIAGWRLNLLSPADLASAGVAYSASTKVRFTANDGGSASIVEAGVDAFELAELECDDGGTMQYCSTSPNSVGSGAVISSLGSVSVSANAFTLVSGNAIPNGSGLFFYGPNMVEVPFGDGFRCVGGATRRLNPVLSADGMGTAVRPVDFTLPPANAGSHMIGPGSTWNFQHWYRDAMAGMSGFNLSNGLSATFLP